MEESKRVPGVDLAKIIAIFLVVMIHVVGMLPTSTLALAWVKSIFTSISMSCIDLFALATGYLCVTAKCRYSRLASLWITTVFWGIVMLLVCQFGFGIEVHFRYYIKALFPILFDQYWFFTAYFLLFLCMPLINKGVLALEKKEIRRLLVAFGIFICIYSCLGVGHDRFLVKGGYSFLWLAIVYVFGAYIRLYWQKHIHARWYIGGAIALVFICNVRQMISIFVGFRIPGDRFGIVSYVSPFTFSLACIIFLWCLSLEIKSDRICSILKKTSALTFGIYLIHVHPVVWGIWCTHFKSIQINSVSTFVVFVVGTSIAVYSILCVIEYIRYRLFQKLGIERVVNVVDKILPRK